jgi:hypothetical protein
MNADTSIGMPAFCVISATGAMSLTTVRQATFGRIRSRQVAISRARRRMSSRGRPPAPGSPRFTPWMPRSSIRCSSSSLSSIDGSAADGDCSPSRSVSSSNSNGAWVDRGSGLPFQS